MFGSQIPRPKRNAFNSFLGVDAFVDKEEMSNFAV